MRSGLSVNEPNSQFSRRDFLHVVGAAAVARSADTRLLEGLLPAPASTFATRFADGAIQSLKRVADAFDTEYIQSGRRLGDAIIKYRRGNEDWSSLETASFTERVVSSSPDGLSHGAQYEPAGKGLSYRVAFTVGETTIDWRVEVHNLGKTPLEIGDLALPLPMNGNFQQQPTTAVLKHSFISGHGSFLFWMRRNSVGPYLTMTPESGTSLEYWESQGGYRVFIHSVVAGAAARAGGTKWRQPNTNAVIAPGATKRYGFKLHWAADYQGVRDIVAREGLVDTLVVPGMTLPRDLSAKFALRSSAKINGVTAEFPRETTIKSLGKNGDVTLYEVRFDRLGENRLTVSFGEKRQMHLEFFSTEPVETMIAKRAAFIASHQVRDPSKWYNGLLAEWAMDTRVQLGPDNYDRIKGWRIYEVTCDDPGLSKPAYLAAKNAEHPVQAEVAALDYYIEHFVWGGLQRSTNEEYPYAIYGIPDWKQNRESRDAGRNGRKHFWRIYDYPHIALMYYAMYRVAKQHPAIKTSLSATEYLRRAYSTAVAMFTIPYEIERWSAYQTGLYNELVIPDVIDALEAEGMPEQADRLRMHWERKVRAFIADRPDLFRSEYAFDSTGFESTHALAIYALKHADRLGQQRPANERAPAITRATMQQFLEQQMQANIFCRGWLETAYYLYGSDYRGSGGNSYTLTYMSQMGGWGVLDYALHHAADYAPYLRLGYASSLSSWALLNSGTPESSYGYWYSGKENDGGAGGGFEPAPFGNTWLEQPHHRGSWYYSCEIDLGFCGALRCARTVLADDPIFGRLCYGGDWKSANGSMEVVPRDGVRRRFHALLSGQRFHLAVDGARFASGTPIVVDESLRLTTFQLERDAGVPTTLALRSSSGGSFAIRVGADEQRVDVKPDEETQIRLPGSDSQMRVLVERIA